MKFIMDTLRTTYETFGVGYPLASLIIVTFFGAVIFGGGWWFIGWQHDKVQEEQRLTFVYVIPQPHDIYGNVPLAIRSVGKAAIIGVKLSIRELSTVSPPSVNGKVIDIGVMPADMVKLLEEVQLKAPTVPGERVYQIEISEQNGIYDQLIKFRTQQAGNKLCVMDSMVVSRRQSISENGRNNSPDAIKKRTLINQDWHAYFPCEDKPKSGN